MYNKKKEEKKNRKKKKVKECLFEKYNLIRDMNERVQEKNVVGSGAKYD